MNQPPILVLALALVAFAGRPEIIYDNSANNLTTFLTRNEEFGDEVDFAGSARVITAMTFEIVGERDVPSTAQVIFRLYRNNGQPLPPPAPQFPPPDELIYQSPAIPIHSGVQPIRIIDVNIPVPDSLTWTVEFLGVGQQNGERAGLRLYHPPIVGRSFRDYWVREPAGFRLFILDAQTPASFAARFEASPDPPVTITSTNTPGGPTVLRVSGPIGTEQILEVSLDSITWRTLGAVSLATNAVASFVDSTNPESATRYYRARRSPYVGATVVLQSVRRNEVGSATLTLLGPVGSEHVVEATSDYRTWLSLDVVRFNEPIAQFLDISGVSQPIRIYRTRPAAEVGQFSRIRRILRRDDGSIVLACTGRPSIQIVTVEASNNLSDWTSIGTFRFDTAQAIFTDISAPGTGQRFYRLQR